MLLPRVTQSKRVAGVIRWLDTQSFSIDRLHLGESDTSTAKEANRLEEEEASTLGGWVRHPPALSCPADKDARSSGVQHHGQFPVTKEKT
ncbi:uncharacterized protein LOC110548988 isoform X3 [Meriones unguiculatus]|uniref:uncharacterized protein LOC110548988 isoform X3 n=1 Tax=Meriones unguiculatus TaxID=10047 RepID=UPI00293E9565|nr:uncharacterized protein LOC110548988 isoform X3 [Meriones unguiculatus]